MISPPFYVSNYTERSGGLALQLCADSAQAEYNAFHSRKAKINNGASSAPIKTKQRPS